MNICVVSQEYPPETPWGGIGTQSRNKAVALAKLGHNVHVLSRSADKGPALRSESDEGVTVHRMQPPGFEFPIYNRATYLLGYSWHVLAQLNELSESVKFDVIDFPEFGAEGFAYQLDRTVWNWAAVVVQLHGPSAMFVEHIQWPEVGSRFERYATFAEELSIQRADALMACSSTIADITSRAHGVPRDQIDIVHCGVDAHRFHCAKTAENLAGRPTVLFVGNIVENKGIHTVVEAVLALRESYPEIHLQILGKIPTGSDLMHSFVHKVAAAGAQRNIEFLGQIDAAALPPYYQRAHVFCSPAEFEGGVANVYLEAMACGCPVVASTAGGGLEAVKDGETGRLVRPNDVAATAAAIEQILSSPSLRRTMSVAARQRVQDYFAMERYIQRVLTVYEKAIVRSQQHPERWVDVRE